MLERLEVRGFKSLHNICVDMPSLTVLFGPNAAGKSNFLDAIQFLAASATRRTLQEALGSPIRGYPVEAFEFPSGGLAGLMKSKEAKFDISGQVRIAGEETRLEYRVGVSMEPASGKLSLADEHLAEIGTKGGAKGRARIEVDRETERVLVRRRGGAVREFKEYLGQNHTTLSVPSFEGETFRDMDVLRQEFARWRSYYLDPRGAMRTAQPPSEVDDIGPSGEFLSAFLYRLKYRPEFRNRYAAVERMVQQVIPSVESVDVRLNEQRAQIDLFVRQNGVEYSSRVISEGTLRVLALAAICVNPFDTRLVAFEEPENGVQPQRLESIAELLGYLAIEAGVQVVVNTHSPLFVAKAIDLQRKHPSKVQLVSVRMSPSGSQFTPVPDTGPLFEDGTIRDLLQSDDDAVIQAALLRGLLGG